MYSSFEKSKHSYPSWMTMNDRFDFPLNWNMEQDMELSAEDQKTEAFCRKDYV